MKQEDLIGVLRFPRLTEKSTRLGDRYRQYVFSVANDACKPEIKRAVEAMFNVQVQAVQVLNMKGKSRRFAKQTGRRSSWKKAYVTLAPDQEINFMGPE